MTAPLTPPDCDLRGYEYMPLYGHHLFGSEFEAAVSDFGWRTGVTLWWAAWNQVPAASLPNDDAAITKLAMLGRDVKSFRKVKAEALRGFVLCDDGRLYHAKLSAWALEAWARRVKERARKAKWREHKDGDGDGPRTGTGRGQPPGQNRSGDVPRDGTSPLKGSEGKGSKALLTTGVGLGTVVASVDNSDCDNDTPVLEKDKQLNNFEAIERRAKACGISANPGESYLALKDRCVTVERILQRKATDLGIKPSTAEDFVSLRKRITEFEVQGRRSCAG